MALGGKLRSRLIGALISVGLFPLWSWIEDTFGIESVGHSGLAKWCFVLIFALLAGTVIPDFWVLRRRHRHGLVMAKPRL